MKKIICILLSILLALPMIVAVGAEGGETLYPDAPVLAEGEDTAVEYDGTEASGVFRFTAEHSGHYEFRSDGSVDTYGVLRTETGDVIASNDDGGGNSQFLIHCTLEEGVTYLLYAQLYNSSGTGSFTVRADWIPMITGLELTLKDPDAALAIGKGGYVQTYYGDGESYKYYSFNNSTIFSVITITATYEDGRTAEIRYDDPMISFEIPDREKWAPHGEENTVRVSSGEIEATINVPVISFEESIGDVPAIALDVETPVAYDGNVSSGFVSFVPEKVSDYTFRSISGIDTYGELYDSFGRIIASNDDGAGNGQFLISYRLNAGEKYFFLARPYVSGNAADITVVLHRNPEIVGLTLTAGDPLTIGIGGSFSSYYDSDEGQYVQYYSFGMDTIFGAVTIEAEYEDGTVEIISRGHSLISYEYDCKDWTAGGENNVLTVRYDDTVEATINVPVITFAERLADVPALENGVAAAVRYTGDIFSGAFRFTAERDGHYEFFSTGDIDTCGELFDAEGKRIASNDDGVDDGNFRIVYDLFEGDTCYLFARTYTGGGASFDVTARRVPDITGLTLSTVNPDDAFYMGFGGYVSSRYDSSLGHYVPYYYFNDETVFEKIVITAEFEDGTTGVISRNYDDLTVSYDCSKWTVGGENTLSVSWGDVEATISVPVAYYYSAFPNAPVLELDTPVAVEYVGETVQTLFTPDEDGTYYFYTGGDADTVGSLYGEIGNGIVSGVDDCGASLNFVLTADLTAGQTYVLATSTYSGYDDNYSVVVSRDAPEFMNGYSALSGLDLTGKMINVVFAVDTTGSMGDEIASVRATLTDFVNALAGTNAHLRIALIDYKDITADGDETTVLHYSPGKAIWFENEDLDALLEEIANLDADGGGDTPESVIDVLGNLVEPEIMTFNSDAARFAFLITDADYKEENNHGIEDMSDLIVRLNRVGVSTSVVSLKEYFSVYSPLFRETEGVFINIRGNFSEGMGAFAAAVASRAADYNPDDDIIPVSDITLGEDLEISVGKIRSFTATITPDNATDSRVVWAVEDESIARITPSTTNKLLVIRGISTGSTRVIARSMDGGYVAYFDLTVSGLVDNESTVESCDIHAIITRIDEMRSSDRVADMVLYSEEGDEPIADETQIDLFDRIIGTGFSVSFVFDDVYGDMLYTWRFPGAELVRSDVPVLMDVEVADPGSPAKDAAGETFPTRVFRTVDFGHEGELPGPADISVATDLPDGEYILFYYDPVSGELEEAGSVTVAGGVASFRILHCSTYVIVSEKDSCETHSFGEWSVTTEPGCTADGAESRTCSVCGTVETRTIAALGHEWSEWITVTEVSCITEGREERACERCGEPEANVTPALGHDWGEWKVKYGPTCDGPGEKVRTCLRCSNTEDVVIPPLGHYFGEDGKAPVCERCGAENPDHVYVNPFTDVPDDAYYAPAVRWAVENEITAGTSKTKFSPNAECTRGQVVTFLWRSAGKPTPSGSDNPFVDVKEDDYFYTAVLWAVESGITKGTSSTKFSPSATCTRGQIVTFLYRAKGSPSAISADNPFVDVKEDDYFYTAVLWAVGNNITQGVSKTKFAPADTCKRAQVVTFLYRSEG